MYLYCWIFVGLYSVIILAEYAFGVSDKLSGVISTAIAVTLGWQGNSLYKNQVQKKVK